ncbi:PLP-dependent transferase [Aquirhabdus parva]|uniref:Cystathionine beta-lyase n=1 Tax=Aquirhabdus parva TaxID=2283318 RepID=A0A345P4P1_9GAMM|nr:PLP-dependent transferase [Aquirhabdus parva]AXI02250.1 cystathionine beta-lyase [Aquirhabdus parva]
MNQRNKNKHQITGLIHHPYQAPDGFAAVQPAIYKASTVIFPDIHAMHTRNWRVGNNYSYGLHGTPTTFTLQERIATLEGGLYGLLAPSGLAAISLINIALLNQGDEVLIPQNSYGPTLDMVRQVLGRFGVSVCVYDPMEPELLADLIHAHTKLIWLEAAGSVTMEFPDLSTLIQIARQHRVMTVLDNTWGAGLAFNAFDLPREQSVDLTMHALTKYPSGGGDVLMGSLVTRDEVLYKQLKTTQQLMGINVAANDAEIVLRSLPTIAVRYAAQDQAARALASWLQTRPEIAQVLHPALPHAKGHSHWHETCSADGSSGKAAGLFSIIFKPEYTTEQVHKFCEHLNLFKLGYSWGGPMSLVVPYRLESLRAAQFGGIPEYLIHGGLVRFSIGLEDVNDLQADITHALLTL